jgi:predicted small lipoprotein YifL
MKNILSILCCLFVLLTIVSCGSGKPIVLQNETIKTKIETVHDTVFTIEKDSSSIAALLECRNGKVVIKNIVQSESGSKLKIPTVRIRDNLLQVDCEAKAQKLFAQYKNTFESENKTVQLPPIEVNKLTFLQELQINMFWVYTLIAVIIAGWVFIKSKI